MHLLGLCKVGGHKQGLCEALTVVEQTANSGVAQPTVCVLTGGVNLSKDVNLSFALPCVAHTRYGFLQMLHRESVFDACGTASKKGICNS